VREAQPAARLIALGLADVKKVQYVDSLLSHLKKAGRVDYVDVITYHGYTVIPEDNYPHFLKLKELVKSYDPEIELWQGENGAPSTPKGDAVGALTKEDWSEITQAKWNLRRMVGDMLYGVDVTSIFQISDMYYGGTDHFAGLNSKGLLKARPDLSIERPKLAYYAYQNTASLFHGKVVRTNATIRHEHKGLTGGVFKREDMKYPAVVLWFANEKPADGYAPKRVSLTVPGTVIPDPVLVDLLSGNVYRLPAKNFKADGDTLLLNEIPITDSPVVITDISSLQLEKIKD
jgi:polysaccharide biosynthesis protein PslG